MNTEQHAIWACSTTALVVTTISGVLSYIGQTEAGMYVLPIGFVLPSFILIIGLEMAGEE